MEKLQELTTDQPYMFFCCVYLEGQTNFFYYFLVLMGIQMWYTPYLTWKRKYTVSHYKYYAICFSYQLMFSQASDWFVPEFDRHAYCVEARNQVFSKKPVYNLLFVTVLFLNFMFSSCCYKFRINWRNVSVRKFEKQWVFRFYWVLHGTKKRFLIRA